MKFLSLFSPIQKRWKRWQRKITLTKRQEFVLITCILTTGLLLTQLVSPEWRYPMVAVLSLLAYATSAVGLREDLKGIEWITLLTLPMLFTTSVLLFYFLLPVRWLTRVPVVILYSVGIYALLLTENIYNVAANRTIALLRAAHSVGFLLTLVSYFLIVQTILAFRFDAPLHMALVDFFSFFLIFQSLWAIELEDVAGGEVVSISLVLALTLIELSWVFYFWPVSRTLVALFMTTFFYSTVGMAQQFLVEKLYKKTIIEFLIVTAIVLSIVLLATRWRGAV